jgi:hypothetical protein
MHLGKRETDITLQKSGPENITNAGMYTSAPRLLNLQREIAANWG